ncbi:MAG: carboxypeptidase regulatory-like domain-containing protein [Candidatus Acidiferrales bacterium]
MSGTVFDQSGAVVQGASTRLFSLDQLRETKSDDQGRFAFTDLPSGAYELQADYPGFDTTIEDFKIVSHDIGPLSITIVSPGVPFHCGMRDPASYEVRSQERIGLAGSVIDSKAGPLAGAEVIVSALGQKNALAIQHTDDKGNFKFRDLPPGKYTITASVKGHPASPGEPFWITRGTLTKITLTTHPKGILAICQ